MATKEPDSLSSTSPPTASGNPSASEWYASLTPEQRAERNRHISVGTKAGMHRWHAGRTEEERELSRQRIKASAMCRIGLPRNDNPGHRWQKGHHPVNNVTPVALAKRELTKKMKASVKRIMADLVGTQPELVRDALIEGLQARPPYSMPYLILASAYLDGKPREAEPEGEPRIDLSDLTLDELRARALRVAHVLQEQNITPNAELAVIDITPEREPTLQELQEQVRQAQEELRQAEEEVRRLKGGTDGR